MLKSEPPNRCDGDEEIAISNITNRPPALTSTWLSALLQALELKKWPLGKLISQYESHLPESALIRQAIHYYIQQHPDQFTRKAQIIGFTGTPGAGKSSLLAEVCKELLNQDTTISIAVLAIDPSSQSSGGSILGDRTRMHSGKREPRLFFRSQASNLELGGISSATFQACRLLRHIFDFIFIETVGIGQNEIDIQYLTDHSFLVMQPLAGDQIQFMKCGIMEIPDSFIVNKCDEEKLARTSYHMLRNSLKNAKLIATDLSADTDEELRDNIFLTSALTHRGIRELADAIRGLTKTNHWFDTEQFFIKKSIQRHYGQFGLEIMQQIDHSQWESNSEKNFSLSYEEKEQRILQFIQAHIKS